MRLRSALLLGIAVQLILVAWALVQPLTVLTRLVPDDAFYYLQIARMLAAGEGSVFSPGEPTNGYHPLWQGVLWALAAGTHPTRLGLVAQALVLCVLCNAGASVLLARLLTRMGASVSQQVLGVLLYLLSPWSLLITLGGLETALWGLTLFAWLLVVARWREAPTWQRSALLGLVAAALFLARTDSIFVLLAAAVALGWQALRGRLPWPPLLGAGVLATLLVSPWLLWNLATFGSIVQQSGTAMTGLSVAQLPPPTTLDYWLLGVLNAGNHLYRVLLRPLVWHDVSLTARPLSAALALCAGGLLLWLCIRSRGVPRWFVISIIAHLVFEIWGKVFTQPWHSFDLIVAVILAGAVLPAFARWQARGLVPAIFVLAVLNVYAAQSGYHYAQEATDMLGTALRFHADSPRRLLVGATDAGYLAYWSRHEVVNMDGIVNARAYEAISAGRWSIYVHSRPFDLVLVDPARLRYYDRALPPMSNGT